MIEDENRQALDEKIEEARAEVKSAGQGMYEIVDDIRDVLYAEMEYYRARLNYSKSVAKWTGLYLAIALCAMFGSVVAAILGLLLMVAKWTNPTAAMIIVSLSSMAIAIIFALLARRSSKRFKFPELGDSDD